MAEVHEREFAFEAESISAAKALAVWHAGITVHARGHMAIRGATETRPSFSMIGHPLAMVLAAS